MEMILDDDVEIGPFLSLRLCTEIARGLAFIHNLCSDKRLVHGDLKAENVLLSDDLHCKIADFGSSVLSNYTGNTTASLTLSGNQFTEMYAAPELLSNPSMRLKPFHDVYSYSMVIFLVLNRQSPITNPSAAMFYLEGLQKGKRPELSNFEKLNSSARICKKSKKTLDLLISTMQRCWKQDVKERPSMLEVRELLNDSLAQIPSALLYSQIPTAIDNMTPMHFIRSKSKCEPIDRFRPVLTRGSPG